jgi:fused signal recognition particle receptor
MAEKETGVFNKIFQGLDKTRKNLISGMESVLRSFTKIDEELLDDLEEALILADVGVKTSADIIEKLRVKIKAGGIKDAPSVRKVLEGIIVEILGDGDDTFNSPTPLVILVIGVNGAGKTTTIGKLAHIYAGEGKSVILAAADTFRAAAIDQLEVWGDRAGVTVIKQQEGSDPGAVVFDSVKAAKARKTDVLICDTAGRLQNKKNLMDELKKMSMIIKREYGEATIETLLVLDATTGQNALRQAEVFKETAGITGLVLTKLDGTAKGGVVIAIKNELRLPVRFVGVGEGIDDLQPFDSKTFAKALFGKGGETE